MTWNPEADEIALRREYADQLGGAEAVARHHEQRRALIGRRAELMREIEAIDARLAETDGKIAEAEQIRTEFAGLRERFTKLCNDAA